MVSPFLPLLFNIVLEVLARPIRQEKDKRHPNQKRKSKTVSVCRWHDLVYRKSKGSSKKWLEPINEFNKVQDTKSTHKNSVAFLYTNNESFFLKKEIISFTIAPKQNKTKRKKNFGINLAKEKDPYAKNCTAFMK